jgi:phosphoadenosine phosphosulfate reductase
MRPTRAAVGRGVPTLEGVTTATDLRALAADADAQLQAASAQDVIRWAADTFGDRLVVTTSMGDGLLSHLVSQVVPGIEVVFLDTGYHFAETIGTRDAVAATYDIRLRSVQPLLTVAAQDAQYGRDLFARDPDACCRMRKVEPLDGALQGYDAWISGNRRDESPERADTPIVGFNERRGKVTIHPVATWTGKQVQDYLDAHHILVNPLQDEGYLSIGCAPCTRAVAPGEDARAGRWAGTTKTECGIHT